MWMMRCINFVFLASLIMLGLPQKTLAQQDGSRIRIGILAFRGNEEAEKNWGPTLAQLQKAMPRYRFELVPGSAAFLTTAVANHGIDFLITNPGHYLELQINYSAVAIATEQLMDGTPTSESVAATIIVPANASDINDLSDLRGRRIAAVSPAAFGYHAVMREFLARGFDLPRDVQLLFVGYPVEGVLKAVSSGRADGGIIRSCLLEQWVQEGVVDSHAFRVIGRMPSHTLACQISTHLYPGWAFVKVAQTSAALSDEVAQHLLNLQPSEGDSAWAPAEDYSPVQDLYRVLKIGPYAPFSRLVITDFLWQYRIIWAFMIVALMWWVFHVSRVSYLLKKRTIELELAYELARVKGEQMEHTHRLSLMGEMASSLAHEINQPLAAILTYARGCERRIASGFDQEGIQRAVELIANQAERAGAIVKRMREFVQKKPSYQLPADLADIIRDTLILFEPTARNRHVDISADLPDCPCPVRADRLQIEEVLLNLLQNALEALRGRDKAYIRIQLRRLDHIWRVSVIDNGSGIALNEIAHVFEAFFTTKTSGLGLGLSLSRTIIEAHGGHISVDSDRPQQTEFWFTLPYAEE
jgi:two-component system, LuxR family, sensor histidine kinase TtrS